MKLEILFKNEELSQNVVLLIDDAPYYPNESILKTNDGLKDT